MNKDVVKVQEIEWWTDLTNGEVNGHLFARKTIEGFKVGGEKPSLEFLELLNSAAARKVELGLWNDAMEKEYPRRNYL